jgi:WD40 repeat protein
VHSNEKSDKNGMVMSLAMFHVGVSLTLVAAYESGLATVTQQDDAGSWNVLYRAQSHSQPVLSLDVSPTLEYFFTSGADAVIVKHPIPRADPTDTTSPLAQPSVNVKTSRPNNGKSLLSAAFATEPQPLKPTQKAIIEVQTQPLKITNTKHSGQQGLRIRSDGKIYATAGWDSKVRVYSAQTMRELAVLKWHQVGCYSVAFANVDLTHLDSSGPKGKAGVAESIVDGVISSIPKLVDITVKDRRIKQVKATHWLAAGSKDGKISLWDIY